MTDEKPSIWHLKDIQGGHRYYPPGQHPATKRMREQLAQAEQIKAEWGRKSAEHGVEYDTGPVDEFIAYLQEQLAQFEQAESDRKARDDWMLRDRDA